MLAALTVALVTVAAALVVTRAEQTADRARTMELELTRAQAELSNVRAFLQAQSMGTPPPPGLSVTPTNDSTVAFRRLDASLAELERLGAAGPAMDAVAREHKRYQAAGSRILKTALAGDTERAIRIVQRRALPALDAMQLGLEAKLRTQATVAQRAKDRAQLTAIGAILVVLLVLGAALRYVDLTGRQARADGEARRRAATDPLTGLPNRAALMCDLQRLTATPTPRSATLTLLDLDDLKTINDSLGHGHGDDLMRTIGARVAATVDPGDRVFRLGGDEFAVLSAATDVEHATAVTRRVLDAIHEPAAVGGREIRISASAGIATGNERESLLRDADTAMYAAKESGKARLAVFDASMRRDALVNLELTADLRRALARDELFLEYQPIVDLHDGGVQGVEALVRWNHPEHGRMPPVSFIGVAERSGLIGQLGWWVMRTACTQMAEWLHSGAANGSQHVSVNVSPLQLAEPDVAQRISRILSDTGLDPHHLQLEITESMLVDESQALVSDLSELRALGVRIAIDDFGTGHSVLAYLRDLPVDVLKIDKAFVDRIDVDRSRARLTTGIVQLAAALDLAIVAEGIEAEPQARMLGEMGQLLGQGYLYSRPVSAARAGRMMRDGMPRSSGGLSEVA